MSPLLLPRAACERGNVIIEANVRGELSGSLWAITGKQYWRCGVIQRRVYGARVLAHLQNPQRMSAAMDSRAVAMKVGIR